MLYHLATLPPKDISIISAVLAAAVLLALWVLSGLVMRLVALAAARVSAYAASRQVSLMEESDASVDPSACRWCGKPRFPVCECQDATEDRPIA